MATELKPCPFCGNNAKLRQFTSGCLKKTKVFYVECCVCRNQTKVELNTDYAIDAWNKRYFHKAIPTVLELEGKEVVRCKDCKYGELDTSDDYGWYRCKYDGSSWNKGDHFCSYGERKDNDL